VVDERVVAIRLLGSIDEGWVRKMAGESMGITGKLHYAEV
jgi:hypothetical protein